MVGVQAVIPVHCYKTRYGQHIALSKMLIKQYFCSRFDEREARIFALAEFERAMRIAGTEHSRNMLRASSRMAARSSAYAVHGRQAGAGRGHERWRACPACCC
jgi:hypothetical protein